MERVEREHAADGDARESGGVDGPVATGARPPLPLRVHNLFGGHKGAHRPLHTQYDHWRRVRPHRRRSCRAVRRVCSLSVMYSKCPFTRSFTTSTCDV